MAMRSSSIGAPYVGPLSLLRFGLFSSVAPSGCASKMLCSEDYEVAPEVMTPLESDVLVIGAGGAGMYAALEAARAGASVILADRSLISRGGATSDGADDGRRGARRTNA